MKLRTQSQIGTHMIVFWGVMHEGDIAQAVEDLARLWCAS